MSDLTQKAQEYKNKLQTLQSEKQELDRQIIILEEQYNQHKSKIEQAFGTSEPEKLETIANGYLQEIQKLEEELKTLEASNV